MMLRRLLLASLAAAPAAAGGLLSNVFGSNMVLQHSRPAPLWGWAAPSATVTVMFGGKALHATAGADGLWRAVLPPQAPSLTPHTIGVASGSSAVKLTNVEFGEVILCSGQSNMEFVLSSAANATAEIAAADGYPHIRVVDGPQQNTDRLPLAKPNNASVPHNELFYQRMNWSVASSETVGQGSDHCCRRRSLSADDIVEEHDLSVASGSGFSAICWFAARDLFDSLGGTTPVGAIDQSYGGTSIQFWMSEQAIAESKAPVATQCCGQNGGPSCLWNTQIAPYTIGPMQLKGVLWYQGEQNANCGGPTQTAGSMYSTMLQTMVTDWRTQFKQPALLFGSCLLAPWKKTADEVSFAELRLAQANLTAHVAGTFTISTLDGGNPASGAVHSKYKQAAGKRAAQGLMANASSGVPSQPFWPPSYASAAPGGASGSVLVTLAATGMYGSPPVVNSGVACPKSIGATECESFAVLGSDCVWRKAAASLKGSALLLTPAAGSWNASAGKAVGTRAYYANWPVVTVTSKAGVPLLPWAEPINEAAKGVCPHSWSPLPSPKSDASGFLVHAKGALAAGSDLMVSNMSSISDAEF